MNLDKKIEKRKKQLMVDSNIKSGFYKTEFKVKDAKKEVTEYILSKKYGDTIEHIALAAMFGYNLEDKKQKSKYQRTMKEIKDVVLEEGYILKGISGIGFYILKPKQVASYSYRTYVQRAVKLIDKNTNMLRCVDTRELKGERIEEFQDILDLNDKISKSLQKDFKESRYINRMEHYNSLVEGDENGKYRI